VKLPSVSWNGTLYMKGDIVYVRMAGYDFTTELFQIADICSLGDNRNVLRGFWYYERRSLHKILSSRDARKWPKCRTKMKSTHMGVIMWDCLTGKINDKQRDNIALEWICDMSADTWSVKRDSDDDVTWALVA